MYIPITLAAAAVMLTAVYIISWKKKGEAAQEMTPEELTLGIKAKVAEIQSQNIYELNLNRTELLGRERQKSRLRNALRACCTGDFGSREYVKELIRGLLEKEFGIGQHNIYDFLPLRRPDMMSAADRLEHIYACHVQQGMKDIFGELIRVYRSGGAESFISDSGYSIEAKDIDAICELGDYTVNYTVALEMLSQRIYQNLYGCGAADNLLFDTSLDGVSAGVGGAVLEEYDYWSELIEGRKRAPGGSDSVYIMYAGKTIRLSFLRFDSTESLIRTVKNLSRFDAAYPLTRRNPFLVSSLRDNSRVVTMRPPAAGSWAFFVRRFMTKNAPEFKELITDTGWEHAEYIVKSIITSEQNIVISGNQGGGKTTLLKAIIGFIDPRYTLRVAEANFEANINSLYPGRNVVCMQERGDFTIFEALKASKKMDSDILILGEINEPKTAGVLVQIIQNGGKMALSTLHHKTTQKLIEYLRNALISECGICDVRIAEEQVVDAVNFDIHMVRNKEGHHYIERITEIVPVRGGKPAYECRNLLEYNASSAEYIISNTFSDSAIRRIEEILGGPAAREIAEYMSGSRMERGDEDE